MGCRGKTMWRSCYIFPLKIQYHVIFVSGFLTPANIWINIFTLNMFTFAA